MFFHQQIHIYWLALKEKCQKQSMANNAKENKKQLEHTYKVNDLVLILKKPYEMDNCPHTMKVPTGSWKCSTTDKLRFYKAHTLTSSRLGASSHTTKRKLIIDPYP